MAGPCGCRTFLNCHHLKQGGVALASIFEVRTSNCRNHQFQSDLGGVSGGGFRKAGGRIDAWDGRGRQVFPQDNLKPNLFLPFVERQVVGLGA
jgi:hypothetical protein